MVLKNQDTYNNYVFQKLQYLEKNRTLADEHACYISPKLGFKQYKLYNNLSG